MSSRWTEVEFLDDGTLVAAFKNRGPVSKRLNFLSDSLFKCKNRFSITRRLTSSMEN